MVNTSEAHRVMAFDEIRRVDSAVSWVNVSHARKVSLFPVTSLHTA